MTKNAETIANTLDDAHDAYMAALRAFDDATEVLDAKREDLEEAREEWRYWNEQARAAGLYSYE